MKLSAFALVKKATGLFSFPLVAYLLAFHLLAGGTSVQREQRVAPYQSLKALRAHIAELKARHTDNGEDHDRPGQQVKEDESTDYLDALEAYLAVRAYPYDQVDWPALTAATQRPDRLNFKGSNGPGPKWEFQGPTNCAPPSQWAFGPGRISGRVANAAFDPTNPLVMYIASSGGGAWKTTNAGASWLPMGDGWSNLPTSCVVVDPLNPSVIFVGTGDYDGWGGYSQGIERSTDGGATWTKVGSQFANFAVRRILIDPENDSIVTAVTGRGSGGNGKVWRSTDGGTTWNAVISTSTLWSDIVCSAKDAFGGRTYYAVAGGSAAQVWRSPDRGATWVKITAPLRTGVSSYDTADLATSPTDPATVYLLGTGDQKVWKSVNSGSTWTSITNTALSSADWGQAWYDFYITCSTNGSSDVLYVGLIDIVESTNAGGTWQSLMNGYTGSDLAHVDEHDAIVDPNNPNHLLTCCDGGVYNVSISGSNGTFSSLNSGLGITEYYWGDFHPTDPTKMIGGAQDNGTPASLGNLAAWRSVTGGDGGAAVINQTNPNVQYSTYQYFGGSGSGGTIGFNRTANNWGSSSWVSVNVGSDRVAWMGPAVMAATNSSVLYVPTNYLWKYTDTTNSWTPRLGNTALSSSSTVISIGVTKADPNVIYTGSGDGQLWVTRDGGSTWTRINTGLISLPNRAYGAVSVRDDNPNDMLVGLSGTGADHLWRCFDTSSGSRTWIDVSGTGSTALPAVPVNAIERDPNDPVNTWYVGTDIGVFKTSNGGSTWDDISQPLGLPNVQISALHVRNGILGAVTYGRGIWTLDVSSGGGGGSITVTGLALNPSAVVGPATSTGTVTLSGPAPSGGAVVNLSSADNTIASVPATVTVPAGLNTANFLISTVTVTNQTVVTLTASLNSSTATADLTVNPNGLTTIKLNPDNVVGGNLSIGTVNISSPATGPGSVVQLSSSNSGVAQVPLSVTIPSGQTQASFNITTSPTASDTSATITAKLGSGTVQADLAVTAATVQSFTLSLTTVVGPNPVQGTITLNGKAPLGGAVIALSSSNTSAATVPASVTVPSGSTTVNFAITTHAVQLDVDVALTETYHTVQRVATLKVTAQKLLALTATPNPTAGGTTVQGRVTLAGPATTSTPVQLSSTNTALASVPSSVTIPTGQSSATFNITTKAVTATSSVQIFATLGSTQEQVTLTLTSLDVTSFTLSSNLTFERSTVIGTVGLNGTAPSGGAIVTIKSSNPLAATMPASVTIPQGQTSKTFTITAKSVTTSQLTTITVSKGSSSVSQNLTVSPIALNAISVTTPSVTGGVTVKGLLRLSSPAPSGGYAVTLTSSNTLVAKMPASLTVPQGSTSAVFTVTTYPVANTNFVQLSATHASSTVSTQLEVVPPEVSVFKLSTSSTKGGNKITGTVTLNAKAPTGGMFININSSPSGLATNTIPVLVKAGSTSVSFPIQTSVVGSTTSVFLTAWTFNVVKGVTLTLTH